MSSTWLEDMDTESGEFDDSDGAEPYDDIDNEDFDGESRSSDERRRQARQRRVALARRRRAQARARSGARSRPRPGGTPSPQRQTVAAIRNLDLETKVQEDTFRSAITGQNRRMSRSEYAAVAGAAVGQFIESIEKPEDKFNPYVKAGLRFAPLMLLSPQRKGTGFDAFVRDPRVLGAAALAGIVVFGENRKRFGPSGDVSIVGPDKLVAGTPGTFFALVTDGNKRKVETKVTYKSSDDTIAHIGPDDGKVTTKTGKTGSVMITATAGDIVRPFYLEVT